MKKNSRLTLTSLAVLLALGMSAVMTAPALADDSAPPPAESVTVDESTGTEDSAPLGEPAAPVEESAPVAESPAPVEESAPVAESPAPVEEPAPTAEILDQIPPETDVIVLNEAGEALPLASQEAAETIAVVDPIWCPTGVAPKASVGGCSGSFSNLSDLVSLYHPAANGTIWISNLAPDSGTNVEIDGATNWASSAAFSLTLQGGWTEGPTVTSIGAPSIFDTYIHIINWTGAVTIKNITFESVNQDVANDTAALTVDTTGNILLDGVTVNNSSNANADPLNSMAGAILDNTNGGTGVGTVIVNNSAFNNNEGDGLNIISDGVVTTYNLSANKNAGNGVYINNTNSATAKAVTMKGMKQFNENGFDGLKVASKGLVTLGNLSANYNAANGVFVDNTASPINAGALISGVNYFMGNAADGLKIQSYGAVTVSGINASKNGVSGAEIDNCKVSGLACALASPVTLNGTNVFYSNTGAGLDVTSGGLVTLNNLTATLNGLNGVQVKNSGSPTSQGVSVLGVNYFMYNGAAVAQEGDGLNILSHGVITLVGATAIGNDGDGAYLDNCDVSAGQCSIPSAKGVTVKGVNVFNANKIGLEVYSYGAVALASLTANDNTAGNGVYVQNRYENLSSVESVGTVVLTGYGAFNHNFLTGLKILSHSNVTLWNLTATNGIQDGVYVQTNRTVGAAFVSLMGSNAFRNNQTSGLGIASDGNITVYNLNAINNGLSGAGYGATLYNTASTGTGNVTVAGFANVIGNAEEGLDILSNGIVSLSNVTAENNGLTLLRSGVSIQNQFVSQKAVSLLGVNSFTNNGLHGLYISSRGAVSVYSLTASLNQGSGAYVDNYVDGTITTNPLYGNVTFFGYARALDNAKYGVYINGRGAVTLNNVTAYHNGTATEDGVYVNNTNGNTSTPQNVALAGTNLFNNNGRNGLFVTTYGVITVYNSLANLNGAVGLNLDNYDVASTAVKGVSLLGYARAYNNPLEGIAIDTRGAVMLANLTVEKNGATGDKDGVSVKNNYNTLSPQNVTLSGVNTFSENHGNGIYVLTYGAIAASNVHASWNGKNGASFDNSGANIAKTLTMNGKNLFFYNGDNGLLFNIIGTVSLSNIEAVMNGQDAVILDSKGVSGVSTGAMTLLCLHTYGNENSGYNLNAGTAAIAIKGLNSFGNGALDASTPTAVISAYTLCP
ncbi:MAG: hypothetical protein Fur002_10140 [Anaerolineales bacterium]